MAVKVNPPPQLRIPQEILKNPEWLAYERQRDTILFQLWQRTGGTSDLVSAPNGSQQSQQPLSLWLQQQLDGLPTLTCDTTGFTADNSYITADMVNG